jgi:hypothetical protein
MLGFSLRRVPILYRGDDAGRRRPVHRDPDEEMQVFNDVRQSLQAIGTQIADIRTAARITPGV